MYFERPATTHGRSDSVPEPESEKTSPDVHGVEL